METSIDDLNTLPPIQAEFVLAIEQEIEASRKNEARTRVLLSQGRRITRIGRFHQYLFNSEAVQHFAADAPAELVLPSDERITASIVECKGLQVTVATEADLGIQVPQAYLRSDLAMLMLRLIDRIHEHSARGNPAGDRLLKGQFSGEPSIDEIPGRYTPGQISAIQSGLGRDSTFIWGPPGTGKTQTIGGLAAALLKAGRRTLIVSHTNTAVDGAILRVAKESAPQEIERGLIIRVGQPRKAELQKQANLLLATHVRRIQSHVEDELVLARGERSPLVEQATDVSQRLDIIEWLALAQFDVERVNSQLSEIHSLSEQAASVRRTRQTKHEDVAKLRVLRSEESELLWDVNSLERLENDFLDTESSLASLREILSTIQSGITSTRDNLGRASVRDEIEKELGNLPPWETLTEELIRLRSSKTLLASEQVNILSKLENAKEVQAASESTGKLARLWKKLPDPPQAVRMVQELQLALEHSHRQISQCQLHLELTEQQASQRLSLDARLAEFEDLPSTKAIKVESERVLELSRQEGPKFEKLTTAQDFLREQLAQVKSRAAHFESQHGFSIAKVPRMIADCEAELKRSQGYEGSLVSRLRRLEADVREWVTEKSNLMREWGFLNEPDDSFEGAVRGVTAGIDRQVQRFQNESVEELRAELAVVNTAITLLDETIQTLEARLASAEEDVIADAMIVGATLTGSYLREALQRHPFDTVIVDEASMAPIPAVWAVAGLALANVVIVGDFKQLPPIVQSEEVVAKKWLGRDIFEVAEVYKPLKKPHFKTLDEQFRMHPSISAVPRELVYDGEIRDGFVDSSTEEGNLADLSKWFKVDLPPVAPLVLVDTGTLDAWVTTNSRGGSPSRLNLVSASLSCRLLGRSLREERGRHEEGQEPRCLVVAPYRPHARLVETMLHDRNMAGETLAGTAHAFQGGEADVVVLDLVNDDPHWRVGLFMAASERNEAAMRLLNVALTRARRRLYIVGDFSYIAKTGKQSFLGGTLIPFLLKNYPSFSAVDILAESFSQVGVEGFQNQDTATKAFWADVGLSSERTIVYSPELAESGVNFLVRAISDAGAMARQTIVVTKPASDFGKARGSSQTTLERTLREKGVTVIGKRKMREQMAVVDKSVWLFSGSVLGSSGTIFSERLSGSRTVEEICNTFAVRELAYALRSGDYRCPICEGLMEMRESGDGPFYWCCSIQGCYSRDIDGPELQDGRLVCKHDGNFLEFDWTASGKPVWRCPDQPRHYMKVAPSHLKLPKMSALIPRKELAKICAMVAAK